MVNVNLLDLMKKSIEERKPKEINEIVLKGFLIINFNSNKYVNDFYKLIDGIISKEIKILGNSVICEFPIKLPPLESGGFWLKCLNQSLNI